jgi:hypothetical protein
MPTWLGFLSVAISSARAASAMPSCFAQVFSVP